MTTMVGFLAEMGSSKHHLDIGRNGAGQPSVKQSLCETVLQIVLQRLYERGQSLQYCDEVREHFRKLPARYALTVDPTRHEDVQLHMKLLNEARSAEVLIKEHYGDPLLLPIVNVRKVALSNRHSLDSEADEENEMPTIPIPKLPKPAFGSNLNLVGLGGSGSPSNILRNAVRLGSPALTPTGRNTPPALCRNTPPSRFSSPANSRIRSSISLSEMEENSCDSPKFYPNISYGWEITVASVDSPGLLKFLTSALSSASLDMNIREAHAFSTTDGMALEVFVGEGWSGSDPEELKEAVLQSVHSRAKENQVEPTQNEERRVMSLKEKVESIAYEDWAVDMKDLSLGTKLGSGSSGRLYRGIYRGQDVAVKVIRLWESTNGAGGPEDLSGTLRAQPASELLQLFQQEVSIMRVVRHKNIVQFIGACSKWPKLYIVTELMSGGSVRDTLQNLGSGLDLPSALRVLRDAARGLDFMHRRGIVHRDVKAANLLIDEHNVVKVCDFGVARMLPSSGFRDKGGPTDQLKHTEMTAETGTYRWMAPEVLEHKPYNQKADVYSFGITIWEVITGSIPHNGLSPIQAAIGVVQRGLRPTFPNTVPSRLVSLAQACWKQNPDERPEFSEVLTTLDEMVNPMSSWQRAFFGGRR